MPQFLVGNEAKLSESAAAAVVAEATEMNTKAQAQTAGRAVAQVLLGVLAYNSHVQRELVEAIREGIAAGDAEEAEEGAGPEDDIDPITGRPIDTGRKKEDPEEARRRAEQLAQTRAALQRKVSELAAVREQASAALAADARPGMQHVREVESLLREVAELERALWAPAALPEGRGDADGRGT